jgi:hypothetical protein
VTILEDSFAGPLVFVIGDAETPASSLTPGAASSNTNLVPLSKIVFGGSNNNCTVTIAPLNNQNDTIGAVRRFYRIWPLEPTNESRDLFKSCRIFLKFFLRQI